MTPEQIARFAPKAKPKIAAAIALGYPRMWAAGINTPLRLAHFMAQIGHESDGFTITEENLNYSAPRMVEVWPTHFTAASAQQYAHNPQALANFIYADANRSPRSRLGNTQPGDGWRYRGRGLIQTTGREGYRRVGHENDPDALANPDVSLDAAIAEFVRTGCLRLADQDLIEAITLKINGGYNGLSERRRLLKSAKAIFAAEDVPSAPPPPATLPEPHIPAPRPRPPAPPAVDPVPPPSSPAAPTAAIGAAVAAGGAAIAFYWQSIVSWFQHLFGG